MDNESEQSGARQPWWQRISLYRAMLVVLILALIGFQIQLWIADGSMAEVQQLRAEKQRLQSAVEQAHQRNQALAAEIKNLKSGNEAMAGRARSNIGMIKKGETFYLTVRPSEKDDSDGQKHTTGPSADNKP